MADFSFLQRIKNLNHNVKLNFFYTISYSFGRGVWTGNVFSAYIFFLSQQSNRTLGFSSAITGIAMTLALIPSGFFADKLRRDLLIKISGIIGVAALVIITFGSSIIHIFIALTLWGVFRGLNRPPLQALLADSLETGTRSGIYSWLQLARQAARSMGPFLNAVLFFYLGNTWEIEILKKVIWVGMGISFISMTSLFFFKDHKSLHEKSDHIQEDMVKFTKKEDNFLLKNLSMKQIIKLIPILIIINNLLIGIGAGMSVKFFPIFFLENYNLLPIFVQIILGSTSVITGILSLFFQKVSLSHGRAEILTITQVISVILLIVIAFYPPLWALIPLYLARGAFINGSRPLSRSILMDIIPKKNRAKWTSLESIAWGLFWNVSALIGGIIIGDKQPFNFRLNFLITSGIYSLAVIPMLFLIPLVGKEISKTKLDNDEFEEMEEEL